MTYAEKAHEKIQKILDKLTVGEAIMAYKKAGENLHKRVVEHGERAAQETKEQIQILTNPINNNGING